MQLNDSINNSFYEEKQNTTANVQYSIPEFILNESTCRFQLMAKQQIQLSMLVDQISSLVIQTIDRLLHQRIYNEISKIIGEVLCIREEVSASSKQQSIRQQEINSQLKKEIKKLKRRLQEIAIKNTSPLFSTIYNNSLKKNGDENKIKSIQGIQMIVKDMYEFMQKNDSVKLFKECEQKLQRYQQSMSINHKTLLEKIQDIKGKQKPINDNLRKQISDALSKQNIDKQIKKVIKQNIKYILDEIIRCRKDVDMLKEEMMGLNSRQKELQFNQTIMQHKLY